MYSNNNLNTVDRIAFLIRSRCQLSYCNRKPNYIHTHLKFKVIGDKDQDGFYWGELRGRRGFVPHNMVSEIDENQTNVIGMGNRNASTNAVRQQSVRNVSRDRWGDIYSNTPVKRMIALYDYDPQELSPNVDAEVCAIILYFFRFDSTS